MELPHVNTWDLSLYPLQDRNHAGSDVYRFVIQTRAGLMDWHTVDEVDANGRPIKKRVNPKMYDIKGLGTRSESEVKKLNCRWGIKADDVRVAEEWIGGKPTLVQMGLWFTPEVNAAGKIVKWVAVDRKKILQPPYWLDVTTEYYKAGGWRDKAYSDFADPYEGMVVPTTELAELQRKVAELEARK